MIKQCRYILKGLQKLVSSQEEPICYKLNTSSFCLNSDVSKTFDYSLYKGEIHAIIRQLRDDGYLLPYSHDIDYGFTLTFKGLHPYRTTWEELKIFLFRSVFIPIAVSFFTTLITLAITG